MDSVNYDQEIPLDLLLASDPIPQERDLVTDAAGQVGRVEKIAPSGYLVVRWLARLNGRWYATDQTSLCAASEVTNLW